MTVKGPELLNKYIGASEEVRKRGRMEGGVEEDGGRMEGGRMEGMWVEEDGREVGGGG
jgi:hypothetical protein